MRDEILKKNAQISAANREYKQILDSHHENVLSDNLPARSAVADTNYMNRIESESTEIKTMLNEHVARNGNRKDKISDLLNDDDLGDDENIASNVGSQQDFIRHQKKEIGELKDKLEKEKQQY